MASRKIAPPAAPIIKRTTAAALAVDRLEKDARRLAAEKEARDLAKEIEAIDLQLAPFVQANHEGKELSCTVSGLRIELELLEPSPSAIAWAAKRHVEAEDPKLLAKLAAGLERKTRVNVDDLRPQKKKAAKGAA